MTQIVDWEILKKALDREQREKASDELTEDQLATLKSLWDKHWGGIGVGKKRMWRLVTERAQATSATPFCGMTEKMVRSWVAAQPAPVDDAESQDVDVESQDDRSELSADMGVDGTPAEEPPTGAPPSSPPENQPSSTRGPAMQRARTKRAKFGDPTQLATMQLTAQPNGTAAPNTRAPLRAEGAASIRTKQTAQQQQQQQQKQ